METGDTADTSGTQGTETGEPLECDTPQLFIDRCGGSICHSGGDSTAAGLDLTSPGVEDRVSGVQGMNCAGILANPADPTGSLLYLKVEDSPECGARMPVTGEPLNQGELDCLRDWISGLLPPGATTGETDDCPDCICEPGEVATCYEGPEGTAETGICVSGMHTCGPDGLSWSPCEGQVTPQGEDCFTDTIDEDCDGETPACSEAWSRSFGDQLGQKFTGVAVGSDGDIYVAGDFEGTASFGGEPLAADGEKADLLLAKYDLYGNPLWSLRYGDSSNQYAASLILDSQDNIIFVGRIYGHVDFGGGEISGEGAADVVIAKFDSDGNHIWSYGFGDIDPDRAERLAVDSQDNVVLTGTFTGEVNYGGGLFGSMGMRDAFVLKLDADTGAHMFSLQIGGPGDDYGYGIAVDPNDNIVIAGRFQDSIAFDGGHDSAGLRDIYLAKLDPMGAVMWSNSFGGPGDEGSHDLMVDPQTGDILLLGFMADTVSFGGPDLVSAGMRDIFLARLDQNGGHLWSHVYGDAEDQFAGTFELNSWMNLALGSNGDIYISGGLIGGANFGGGEISASGTINADIFFAQLDAGGNFIKNNKYGGTSTDIGLGIDVTDSGYVVLAGRSYGSSLDFGASGMVENAGGGDAILVKLAP